MVAVHSSQFGCACKSSVQGLQAAQATGVQQQNASGPETNDSHVEPNGRPESGSNDNGEMNDQALTCSRPCTTASINGADA